MTYTWDQIEYDWLDGGRLALSQAEVVRAFNAVAGRFGQDWVEASRIHNGVVVRGMAPALHIVTLGQMLESLGDAPNADLLLDKVGKGQPDARAELTAIHLVRVGSPDVAIEIEPSVLVGTRNRKPDFRVRRQDGPWTYVEVTQASSSQAQTEVSRGLESLTGLVNDCAGSFALEVFLKREPSLAELASIESQIMEGYPHATTREVELPSGLGALYWNASAPGTLALDDHGEPYTPRLSRAAVAVRGTEHRHIAVRWPFTDRRAQTFLEEEAKQLPKEFSGLIMIQTSGAVGAMKAWRSLIEPRFQPTIHTRVSAVCLFSSGLYPAEAGEEWRAQTKLIINPYARISLPEWIVRQLEQFPSDEIDLVR